MLMGHGLEIDLPHIGIKQICTNPAYSPRFGSRNNPERYRPTARELN